MKAEIYYYDNPHPVGATESVSKLYKIAHYDESDKPICISKRFFREHYELVEDFEVDDIVDVDGQTDTIAQLESVFAVFNSDDNPLTTQSGQCALQTLGVRHTSMSIGDIIYFKDIYYIVVSRGFLPVYPVEDAELQDELWETKARVIE